MRPIDADSLIPVTVTDSECWRKEVYYKADVDATPTLSPPPNAPLTLDELRAMEGEPVWISPHNEWMLVNQFESDDSKEFVGFTTRNGCKRFELAKEYDATWTVYRRKTSHMESQKHDEESRKTQADTPEFRAFLDLRKTVADYICEYLKKDCGHKSYEGTWELLVSYPSYFEDPTTSAVPDFYQIKLHCYVLGPSRHYEWSGSTLKEALARCKCDILRWIEVDEDLKR